MKYNLACSSWTNKEIDAATNVLKSGFCTMGTKTEELERKFADYFGSKYCVFSNSGSSANLLAISALMYAKNGLKEGDTVLVPTVSWSTTYYPIHQNRLKMKFIDIDEHTFNISISEIEKNITPDVKAIFAVNLLGNPCELQRLKKICDKHNLILIEDNCESMGARYNEKFAGTYGVMGTFSGFFSHHICTVEGGFTVTDSEELYQIMISLRAHGWTRGLPDINYVHNKDGVPFNDLFRFVLPGYNLRPNDIFAAIGIEQLDKLPFILEMRERNAYKFREIIRDLRSKGVTIRTQEVYPNSTPSWFGFPIILEGKLSGQRTKFAEYLIMNGVECRPIVAGNFTKNPVIKYMDCILTKDTNAEELDKNGLFIGNNHSDLSEEIQYFANLVEQFCAP